MMENTFFLNIMNPKAYSILVYALVNIAPKQFTLSLSVSIL